jgi:phosphoglycerate dehydrogenase-like enzyme
MNVLVSIQSKVNAWSVPADGVETLRRRFPHITFTYATQPEQRSAGLKGCDVAFTWYLTADELQSAPRLRWVHTSAVAVETMCLPELFARNIAVSNTRGVQAWPIAEHTIAAILALAKQLPFALEQQRTSRWAQNEFVGDRLPWLLRGQTLGLIGVGTIGADIAKLASAFGMRVVAVRRRPGLDRPAGVEAIVPLDRLDDLLPTLDVLAIAAPLTPETDRLIDADALSRMKRGAVLVNVGRGRIVDNAALVAALRSGHLGGACLDVFEQEPLPADDPLWTCPNVIITPHTSGFRRGHWDEVLELFSENIRRFERGEALRFRVDPALGY